MKKIKCPVCSHVFESATIHAECPKCLNMVNCDLHELKQPDSDTDKFESFCKKNDLEYDFSFMSGGKFYRSSETNKAFAIYKWSDFRGKG